MHLPPGNRTRASLREESMQAHRLVALVAIIVSAAHAYAASPLSARDNSGQGSVRIGARAWDLAVSGRRGGLLAGGAAPGTSWSVPLSESQRVVSNGLGIRLEPYTMLPVPGPISDLLAQPASGVEWGWPLRGPVGEVGNPRPSVDSLAALNSAPPAHGTVSTLLPDQRISSPAAPQKSAELSAVPESAPFLALSLGILLAGVLRFRVLTV
jgi:hypothetical protein